MIKNAHRREQSVLLAPVIRSLHCLSRRNANIEPTQRQALLEQLRRRGITSAIFAMAGERRAQREPQSETLSPPIMFPGCRACAACGDGVNNNNLGGHDGRSALTGPLYCARCADEGGQS